jgi:hypothetical protein
VSNPSGNWWYDDRQLTVCFIGNGDGILAAATKGFTACGKVEIGWGFIGSVQAL